MKKMILSLGMIAVSSLAPVFAAVGGPDTFGYTWIDSNEPGGPVFNWIEIATPAGGAGTYRSAINCDDCHEAGIPIGFNFPFYGTNNTAISISSNGTVYFENVYLGLSNNCMPGTPSYTMAQYAFIAHMWDDLAPNYQGGIYTYAGPNYFVIEYYDIVPCCTAGDGDTWEVILFRNGNILMQYKELSNQGVQSDFTIGIQGNPTTGLQYRCDNSGIAPASGTAILWQYPSFTCAAVNQNIITSNVPLCNGASATLSAAGGGIAYLWSNAATTDTIPATSGSYSIIALDTNGCSILDTVSFNAPPVVNLGTDVEQCGGTVTLDAANAGSTFNWSTSENTQTIAVSASGSYSVEVTDGNGCINSDTAMITLYTLPVVNLGNDIEQCGGSIVLDAAIPATTYLWNDGTTTQTTTVSASGTYWVNIEDTNGCTDADTINVTFHTIPTVNFTLTNDTVCTSYGVVTLTATPAGGAYSGTGVSGGMFTPATAGVGTHPIQYIYVDNNNCSDTAVQNMVVLACLGVEGLEDATVQVYPNPAKGQLYISNNFPDAVYTLDIIDMKGSVLSSQVLTGNLTGVDVSAFTNGVYIVRVSHQGHSYTHRLIISK